MDLSTLDPTKPDNSELARLGASRIRDVALAAVTSFGLEHGLTGEHKFLFGDLASRPAPGHAGRLYFNTELNRLERDNGSAWVLAHVVQLDWKADTTARTLSLAPTFVPMFNVNVPQGARFIALAIVKLSIQGTGRVTGSILLDATELAPSLQSVGYALGVGVNTTQWVFGIHGGPAAGVVPVIVKLLADTSGVTQSVRIDLTTLVL